MFPAMTHVKLKCSRKEGCGHTSAQTTQTIQQTLCHRNRRAFRGEAGRGFPQEDMMIRTASCDVAKPEHYMIVMYSGTVFCSAEAPVLSDFLQSLRHQGPSCSQTACTLQTHQMHVQEHSNFQGLVLELSPQPLKVATTSAEVFGNLSKELFSSQTHHSF